MTTVPLGVSRVVTRPGIATWKRVKAAASAVTAPHKAALARLLDMPLMVTGIGLIDFGAFHYVHMIGWIVTGVSLILVEHMISDPDEPGAA